MVIVLAVQESDVYFMSTTCGRPQREGVRLMWTHLDRAKGVKANFSRRHIDDPLLDRSSGY